MQRVKAYIGIGSNLGDPVQQVRDVLLRLAAIRDSKLVASSSLYRTEPVSDIDQDDYINAAACLETALEPTEMLLELQAIEHAFYRQRFEDEKWGPRTMDLDILLFGTRTMQDSHLTIPHAQLHNRLFVLISLKEIAGDMYLPGLGSLSYLIEQAPSMRMDIVDGEKTVA